MTERQRLRLAAFVTAAMGLALANVIVATRFFPPTTRPAPTSRPGATR